jgi:hypothetical protein
MNSLGVALIAGLLCASPIVAQEIPKSPPRIEDNSFLIEEAYNQDAGVVQHIGTFRRSSDASWLATFTQEWPAPSQRHQLSYTVPIMWAHGDGVGAGDLALNYRYQALGRDDERLWFAPRLTVFVPTGSAQRGRGAGGPGVQVNLPLSITASPLLVTHWNLGGTISRSRAVSGARATPKSLNAGASAIFLASPNLNLMLEGLYERNETLDELGGIVVENRTTVVPGLRGAINFASGMQIVPGIGFPISGANREDRDVFLYFSVEHSFR